MSAVIRRISATVVLLGAAGVMALPAQTVQANAINATTVVISWTALSGADRYYVQRALGHGPNPTSNLINLSTPKITATSYTDATAPAQSEIRYRVITKLTNGNTRYSQVVTVNTPAPGGAPVATKPPPSGGEPRQVPFALSPGQPITQVTMAPRDPHAFVAVPGATAAMAPAAPPAPSPAAPATSGRYRVVANGFSVVQQAHSHHDDVYGGFIMLHFNRQNGELMDQDARHTKVLGDINGRVFGETDGGDFNRLRAGTANPTGGLKNGDSYPDAGHARFRGQDGTPPNRVTFPFEIWSGDLTNASDAVVILPSLWSRDGKLTGFDQWQSSELSAGSQIWYDQAVQQALHQPTLGVVAPPGAVTPNGDPNFTRLAALVGTAILGGMGNPTAWALALPLFDPSAHDFPIGFDPYAKALPRRAIVLTREMIEQALASPAPPLSPTMLVPNYPAWILGYLQVPVGVIPVLLFDHVPPPGEPLRTAYVMYLQVERM